MSIHLYEKSGKTYYRVVFRVNGKQKQRRGFTTKAEAKRAERKLLSLSESHGIITSPRLTVSDYLESWYAAVEGTRKVGDSHKLRIGQHLANIVAGIGHIKIQSLQVSDVLTLRKKLQNKHAPRTIKQMEVTLKAAIMDGLKHGVLSSSPEIFRLQCFKTNPLTLAEEEEVQVFEPSEQKTLIDAARLYAEEHDPRWLIIPILGLHTGMRKGEMYALQGKHINLAAKQIRVEQSLEYSKGDTNGRLKTTKTKNGKRTIFISNMLCEEISRYQLWVKKLGLKMRRKANENDFLVFHDDYGPLHKSAPQTRWNTILRRAALEHRGMHALRHTHASNMIDAGMNIKMLSKRLGHGSINITLDTYGHIYKKQGEEQTLQALEKWQAQTF